jgi:hypothetical protein
MPWIVRASPPDPVKPNWSRPWPDSELSNAVKFAQISSAKARATRTTREVIWVCGDKKHRKEPRTLFIFKAGQRVFPKGRVGDPESKRNRDLRACMGRMDGFCEKGLPKEFTALIRRKSPLPPPALTREQEKIIAELVRGRRRKVKLLCPITAAEVERRQVAGIDED